MNEKANYQYFNNISQRINLSNETKSLSIENLKSNDISSSGWFSNLSNKNRLINQDKLNRQNSCTSSEAGSLISFNKSSNNSKNDINEKADTINKSKLDINEQKKNKLNSPVALRYSTKSNRSTSKLKSNSNLQQKKDEFRKQSKEEIINEEDKEKFYYHRFSSPEPDFIVPNNLVYQHYLNYLKFNNLNLNLNQLNQINQLNYLNQLNQLNLLQSNFQTLPLVTKLLNQPTNLTKNSENQQELNTTTDTIENLTTEQQLNTVKNIIVNKNTETNTATTTATATTNREQFIDNNKPQLVQCPKLTNNNITQLNEEENLDSKLNQQQLISEQIHNQATNNQVNLLNKTNYTSQLICDEIKNLNLANSESDSERKEKKFQFVKEFDINAHLYMSNQQMEAMEELIRNNPRTCVIHLTSSNEELGFNLITIRKKKKPYLAHIVKKVNPNLVSAKSGLLENDQLLMVNKIDCRDLTHQQVVKLLGKREKILKLIVCQPTVYQWYLNEGYELKLDYDNDEQENIQQNNQQIDNKKSLNNLNNNQQQHQQYYNQEQLNYQPAPLNYNERCVDDIRPIQVHDQIIPYADNLNNNNLENVYKDNQINSHQSTANDQLNSRNSFKRSYRLKKNKPTIYADDVVDDSLSMSTSVSPFDEKYSDLRDEIFNPNQSLKTSTSKTKLNQSNLNKNLSKSTTDNYNYESKNIEYNEYMDSSSHKLEKSETIVEINNDEFQNKKVTRRSVERLHKQYDDQPMKNVLQSYKSNDKLKTPTTTTSTSVSTTTRSNYTPVYGKTSLFSNSLFDKPKTTTTTTTTSTSIFDRPSIFDSKYDSKYDSNKLTSSDKLGTTSKTSYLSPNYNSKTYNQSSYNSQSYSSSNIKNESSYSKTYISPTKSTPYLTSSSTSPTYEKRQTSVKEPYIERSVIEPKEAKLVHIQDDEQDKKMSKLNQTQEQQQQKQTTKPFKTVQANTPDDLPSPRLCTLKLPKDRIASFGFTIKTSRKTNAKIVVDIVRNSIAHRGGLRRGDLIVEINERFVGQDSHQQVTDRIKAAAEDEVRFLVVSEPEMDIYRNYGLIPNSKQTNIIKVQYDTELNMPLHTNDYDDTDCTGCASFLDNLTAKQYRTYLQSNKKRPDPANNSLEFEEKIKKFEKL